MIQYRQVISRVCDVMARITLIIGLLLLTAAEAFSHTDISVLKSRYEADRRDVKAVAAYAEALEEDGRKKEAEDVVRDFMSRCPVVQMEDRDTYLLINRYVFEDPYSNAFEYGVFMIPRMKWDREELSGEERERRMSRKYADMKYGVSRGDEIDKRFEVLILLSRKLLKEVSVLCDPQWEDGHYILPDYDGEKIAHIRRLLDKGDFVGEDGMRVRISVAEAINSGEYGKAMDRLCTAADLNLYGVRGSYLISMMRILAEKELGDDERKKAISTLAEQARISADTGSSHNYYTVLGIFYQQTGDSGNAGKYLEKGRQIDAEREALYNEMMNKRGK